MEVDAFKVIAFSRSCGVFAAQLDLRSRVLDLNYLLHRKMQETGNIKWLDTVTSFDNYTCNRRVVPYCRAVYKCSLKVAAPVPGATNTELCVYHLTKATKAFGPICTLLAGPTRHARGTIAHWGDGPAPCPQDGR